MKIELAALRLAVKTLTEKYGWVYADDAHGGPEKFTRKRIEILAPAKTLGRKILVRLDADTDIIRVSGIRSGVGRFRDTSCPFLEVPFSDPNFEDRISRFEEVLVGNSELAYDFAAYVLQGPFPAGEAAIAKDARWARKYAEYVLEGPFHAGEAAIATDAGSAYWYAREVLKAPFPAGEAAIATDAEVASMYAHNVLKARFPAGEAAIAMDKYHHGHYQSFITKLTSRSI